MFTYMHRNIYIKYLAIAPIMLVPFS
jgi:hypothetical protein